MQTKVCYKCKIEKLIEDFHRNKRFLDGRAYECKSCRKAYRSSERYLELNRKHYKNFRERHPRIKRIKVVRIRHRDPYKRAAYYHARRSRLRNAGKFTAQEWRDLLERCNHQCLCCGSSDNLSVDHIIPVSKGGANTIDNLQVLCGLCNCKKHTKTIDYRTW